jgi:sirohydrochlorin cobaltochelatase
MSPQEHPAIALVAYGSLNPQAMATYARIKERYERELPGADVRLAFTSGYIRRRLLERDGNSIPNPFIILAELQDMGHEEIVVQSLQIAPGEDFHQVALLVQGLLGISGKFGLKSLKIGNPLLVGLDDCMKVSAALASILERAAGNCEVRKCPRDAYKSALVLMGHGSRHPGDSVYSLMANVLEREHTNVFLGTLEGYPGISDVLLQLKRSGAKEVRLMPFLLVAGGHVQSDMVGEGQNSWRNAIEREGFETEVYLMGLGESEQIIDIFVEHTRKALERNSIISQRSFQNITTKLTKSTKGA